jgi:hypothetical protein
MSFFSSMIDSAQGVLNKVFGDTFMFYLREDYANGFGITGIFEAKTAMIDSQGENPVETRKPTLSIRKTDYAKLGKRNPMKGDRADIVYDGVPTKFEVTEVNDDGAAEIRMTLMKVGNTSYA